MPQVAPYSGAMLPMVARSASGSSRDAGAVELDELADDAELAQRLRHGQHEIGCRGAFAQLAGELVADHLRHQHGDGLAEHRGLGLDAADAPAEHAEAVDHGGVRVGADERVGIGDASSPSISVVKTTRARYSRLTWWQMPMPGGTAEKLRKAVWPHLRKA